MILFFQAKQSANDHARSHSSSKMKKSNTNNSFKPSSRDSKYSRKGNILDKKNLWKCRYSINYIVRNRVLRRILVITLATIIAAVILILLIFLVFENRTSATTSMILLIYHYWENENIQLFLIEIKYFRIFLIFTRLKCKSKINFLHILWWDNTIIGIRKSTKALIEQLYVSSWIVFRHNNSRKRKSIEYC